MQHQRQISDIEYNEICRSLAHWAGWSIDTVQQIGYAGEAHDVTVMRKTDGSYCVFNDGLVTFNAQTIYEFEEVMKKNTSLWQDYSLKFMGCPMLSDVVHASAQERAIAALQTIEQQSREVTVS